MQSFIHEKKLLVQFLPTELTGKIDENFPLCGMLNLTCLYLEVRVIIPPRQVLLKLMYQRYNAVPNVVL